MHKSLEYIEKAKCASLDPFDADELFFPSTGGKKNKAVAYCADCPVATFCLLNAIATEMDGFVAGTNVKERSKMGSVLRETTAMLSDDEIKKMRKRKVVVDRSVTSERDYLNGEPSDEEIFRFEKFLTRVSL